MLFMKIYRKSINLDGSQQWQAWAFQNDNSRDRFLFGARERGAGRSNGGWRLDLGSEATRGPEGQYSVCITGVGSATAAIFVFLHHFEQGQLYRSIILSVLNILTKIQKTGMFYNVFRFRFLK